MAFLKKKTDNIQTEAVQNDPNMQAQMPAEQVKLEKPKKEKKKKEKKKKKVIVENHGITEMGTDYTVYILSKPQKILSALVGFAIGFGAGFIYFNMVPIGIILGIIVAFKTPDIYMNMRYSKRLKELRVQFRDLLESLSNSYTVGMTANRAFHAAYEDMVVEHGEHSHIAKEVALICSAHDNQGIEIKDMIVDFADRCRIDDVKSFASVFDVSSNLGGDIAKVIRETRDMIGDKIETELEIQTMVTGQKNQLNVLALMPLGMSLLTRFFGEGSNSAGVIGIKIVALVLFVFAYWWGTKIVDIKV